MPTVTLKITEQVEVPRGPVIIQNLSTKRAQYTLLPSGTSEILTDTDKHVVQMGQDNTVKNSTPSSYASQIQVTWQ